MPPTRPVQARQETATPILRALVGEGGNHRTVLLPIVDEPAVRRGTRWPELAMKSTCDAGGSIDPRFEPLPIRVKVKMRLEWRLSE